LALAKLSCLARQTATLDVGVGGTGGGSTRRCDGCFDAVAESIIRVDVAAAGACIRQSVTAAAADRPTPDAQRCRANPMCNTPNTWHVTFGFGSTAVLLKRL